MPQFTRKERKINYYHKKCKKYLRFDFEYRCAYCGLHEFENIASYNFFQIDHFRPKKKFSHLPDIDDYKNLFYSCSICNGRSGKSDNWDDNLLNPCVEEIYGDDYHIKLKPDPITYKLISNSDAGKIFIDTIKLDQKKHREIRRDRLARNASLDRKKNKLDEMICDLERTMDSESKRKVMLYLIEQKEQIKNEYLGPYYKLNCLDEEEIAFFNIIKQIDSGIKIDKIFEENQLDFKLSYGSYTVKCYVEYREKGFLKKGNKAVSIGSEQLDGWKRGKDRIVYIVVNPIESIIYFSPVPLEGNLISFDDNSLLTKDSFVKMFSEELSLSDMQVASAKR